MKKREKITWKDTDIWKSCYDDLYIFREKWNILKDELLVLKQFLFLHVH